MIAVVIGVVLAVAVDVARLGGPFSWLARHGLGPPYDPRGVVVQVDGRDVYVDCRGTSGGGPTVVLDAGYGSGASAWGFVLDEVAGFDRVCAWDRPGIGRSAARGRHDAADTIEDLRAALSAAGESPPYLVVGHSLGGVYARVYAALHPDEVAGLVMVDAYYPDLRLEERVDLPPAYVADSRAVAARTGGVVERGEDLDWAATLRLIDQAAALPHPTEILAVDQSYRVVGLDPSLEAAVIEAWVSALHERFTNATITIAHGSDHLIQLRRPDLVVDAIRRLRDAAAR